MFKVSSPSHHSALDQRSWESKIKWRAYDIPIDFFERTDFTDYDMLDAMIASTVKMLLTTHVHFRKRVCVEEQRAQKGQPILTREAYCFCDHFRATGAYEAVQGISDLFNVRLPDRRRSRFPYRMGPNSSISKWITNKKTIVLSRTKCKDTDWRKDTLKKCRQQRRKPFWNMRQNYVPISEKVYEPVM